MEKKQYVKMVMTPAGVGLYSTVLSGSITTPSAVTGVESVGHEKGAEYDFSSSTFNQEWDTDSVI